MSSHLVFKLTDVTGFTLSPQLFNSTWKSNQFISAREREKWPEACVLTPEHSGSNWNLEVVVFEEWGKPEYSEKNLSEQR